MLHFPSARCYKDSMDSEELGWTIVLWCSAIALKNWAVMLFVGILHAEILHPITPAGFWVCLPLTILLNFILYFRLNAIRD